MSCKTGSSLVSSDSEDLLKYILSPNFTHVDACLKLVNLLDQVRLKWKSAAEENKRLKDRVNDLECKNKELNDYINVLKNLTNIEQTNQSKATSNCAPFLVPCYLNNKYLSLHRTNTTLSSDSDTIKVDGMDVNVDQSPIRNKRSSSRLSDEPTPKMRIDAAPLATLDECGEKENNEIYAEIQDASARSSTSGISSSTYVIKGRDKTSLRISESIKSEDNRCSISRRYSDNIPFSEDELEQDSPPQTEFIIRKKLRRSVSLNDLVDRCDKTPANPSRPNTALSSKPSQVGQKKSYDEAVTNRSHQFFTRRVLVKLMCMSCNQQFKFGYEAYKCKACKWVCHPKCRSRFMMCIPYKEIQRTNSGSKLKLVDYCGDSRPRLPHPVLRLVNAMDSVIGSRSLYVSEANEKVVLTVFQDAVFKKYSSRFSNSRPEVISRALLKFLAELRDPLILKTSIDEFLAACNEPTDVELENVINELPIVHKNTLAFLCLHWQNVLDKSEINKLTSEALGREISPVLMRISQSTSNFEQYVQIFNRMMGLEQCFWKEIIEQDSHGDGIVVRKNSKNYVNEKLVRCTTTSQLTPVMTKRINLS